jgi:uncharacterized protein YecE (DUF72 family)
VASIRIGTCSWKYPSWRGLVYSASKSINYLEEYARRYDTVEVDQWFWSLFAGGEVKLPDPKDVDEYRRSVSDDFLFSVKLPNSLTLTHFHKKQKSDPLAPNLHFLSSELQEAFLSRMEPLGDLLGPLMLQFEYLNRQKMSGQKEFLALLRKFAETSSGSHEYAIEVRNAHYLNAPFFDLLEECGLSPVLLQGYWMPSILDVYDKWRERLASHDTVIIRLHGGDRKGMEQITGKRWDRIVEPRDGELASVAGMIENLAGRGADVYVNVNNHYEGCAPLTIERLRGYLS